MSDSVIYNVDVSNEEMEGKTVEDTALTEVEAYNIAEMIDLMLMQYIRSDPEFDNVMCLMSICDGFKKLCKIGGYTGIGDEYAEKN